MAEIAINPIPGNVKDLIGERFGRLTVIGFSEKVRNHTRWVCACDCGSTVSRRADHLRAGRSTSCGCYNTEVQAKNFTRHGGASSDKTKQHPLYGTWSQMKKRCYNASCDAYPYYGGRGIGVADAWRDNFAAFARDMGDRPAGCTLDRIDNDQDYGPNNCRWADKSTQMKNRRRFTRSASVPREVCAPER